jgi:transcriptional regulator with XRE-family HTH domain
MASVFERFNRTPANFRALRDMVGFKQDEFASIVDVDRSAVRRWDSGKEAVPEVAWRVLEGLVDDHFALVGDLVATAGSEAAPAQERGGEPVRLTYYRSRDDFSGEGDWQSASNAARAAAERLLQLGYTVEFVYPAR